MHPGSNAGRRRRRFSLAERLPSIGFDLRGRLNTAALGSMAGLGVKQVHRFGDACCLRQWRNVAAWSDFRRSSATKPTGQSVSLASGKLLRIACASDDRDALFFVEVRPRRRPESIMGGVASTEAATAQLDQPAVN